MWLGMVYFRLLSLLAPKIHYGTGLNCVIKQFAYWYN